MEKYKVLKVFDCQKMPDEVRHVFFESYGDGKGNDCYVEVCLDDDISIKDTETPTPVEDWLIENGASIGEQVIVSFWW